MTVTEPFAKPTAIWDKSSVAAKADIYSLISRRRPLLSKQHTGNCLRPFAIVTVLRQVGTFVFFTNLSSAHTLSSGSLLRSSYRGC